MYLLDSDGNVLTWNAGAEQIKGYRAEEIIGRSFECFYSAKDVQRGKPQRELEIAATTGSYEDENWRVRRDGTPFWANVVITALRNADGRLLGFSKILHDLTTHKLSEDVCRAVVEYIPDAIVVTDSRGKIALVNAQTEALLGYQRTELMAKELEMLVPPRLRGTLHGNKAGFGDGPRSMTSGSALELYALRKDGKEVPAEISLGTFATDSGTFVTTVIRDISDRRRLQADLETARMQMIGSARLSSLGTMAGGIAHEINNPLAVIHALACDLAECAESGSMVPEQVAQTSRRIEQYADRIGKIVNSLRHIARDGDTDPLEEASVREIVGHAMDLCNERFGLHSVSLVAASIDPDIRLMCREVHISQILVNLLQNAFDAAMDGVGEKWVRLEVIASVEAVTFAVTDSGSGVPPELRARIMDPFFTTKPVGKGTGLGLSLSKQFAEEHGGTLTMRDGVGHTCFLLRLPRFHQGAV